ncbi:MAG: Ig-like domain-containing protein [Terracidiphilus sp.]|jgi:hypothetical protein
MGRKSNSFNFALASFTFLIALITGCSSGSKTAQATTTPTATFSVASSSPASGATSVSTTTPILVTFSGPANATTVDTTDIKLTTGSGAAVAGAVTYNATTYVATFTPTAALAANTTYTVTVTGVTSSSGVALASDMTSIFTTAAATSPAPTVQFQTTLFPWDENSGNGQISINTAGQITIQLTGATSSTTYSAQFCPAFSLYTQQPYACIALGNVTTSASGSASVTTQFPQAGSWAGDFQLNSGSVTEFQSCIQPVADAPPGIPQVYTAILLPETTVNGKGDGSTGTQSPLTSGSVTYTYSSQLLQFTLAGASPDAPYTGVESGVLGGSQTYELYNSQNQSAFTTNSSGGVTFTVLQDGTSGDIFLVESSSNSSSVAGYIGGFAVPAS